MIFSFFIIVILLTTVFSLFTISSHITFGYDQARDAFESYAIWHNHHLKILGPTSDIQGLNHGVLWYYFLSILYFLTRNNIEIGALLSGVLITLTIPIIYYFSLLLFRNKRVSLIAMVLYACAPLFFAFTHWLSNPILSLLITPFLLFLVWKFIEKRTNIIAACIGLSYGLLVQSDFAFVVLLFTVPLYVFAFRIKLIITQAIFFAIGFIIAVSTFIFSDIKFHIPIIPIIAKFFSNSHAIQPSIGTVILSFIDVITNLLSITVLPFPKPIVFVLLVLFVIFFRKKIIDKTNKPLLFLEIWLSGIVILFLFNHGSLRTTFLLGPMVFPLSIFAGYLLTAAIKKDLLLNIILVCIILFQIITIRNWLTVDYSPLSIQEGITLDKEKKIVDYTYLNAQNSPFIITTITNPLYINTTWAYIYEFYGKNTYGYLPYWGGRSQVGYLGNLPEHPQNISLRYLIIEPQTGISEEWVAKITYDEDKLSDIVEKKQIGNFIVEKRLFHPNKGFVPIPAIMLSHPKTINF